MTKKKTAKTISRFASAVLAAATVVLAAGAQAQTYPSKPISLVVPFPAGGYVDSFARVVTAKIGPILGQTMPVINRPGAGGTIGAESVAKSSPDGYTLLLSGVSSLAIFQAMRSTSGEAQPPELSYVALVASTPGVMTTSTASGVKSFKQLVDEIRREPGKYSYGSAGPGTPSHLWSAEIVRRMKLDVSHVAYKGGAPALQELSNNQIIWMIDTPVGSGPLVRAGKLTPLAIIAPQRIKQFPDTPAIGELGIPELGESASILYLAAAPKTPAAILDRLNAAYNAAIKDPEFAAKIESFGSLLPRQGMTPDDVRQAAERDYRSWFESARQTGVKVQ